MICLGSQTGFGFTQSSQYETRVELFGGFYFGGGWERDWEGRGFRLLNRESLIKEKKCQNHDIVGFFKSLLCRT